MAVAATPAAGEQAVAEATLGDAMREDPGCWVAPIAVCTVAGAAALEATPPIGQQLNGAWSLDDYLTLVDAIGRVLRDGKRGRIPPELAPLLARIAVELEQWLAAMRLAQLHRELGVRLPHAWRGRCSPASA